MLFWPWGLRPNWAYAWNTFDWFGFWTTSINAAKSVGANCIKFNCGGISPDGGTNYPPDAVLRAELMQVCNYAASLGMAVYLQIAYQPQQQFLSDGSGVTAGVAASVKICGWADFIQNIVAIDLCNEWDINQPSTWATSGSGLTQALADLNTLATACAAVTSKPLTISVANLSNQTALWASAAASKLTFLDQHYYYYNNAAGALQYTFQSPLAAIRAVPNYPGHFILGETGMVNNGTTLNNPQQTAWMSAVPSLTAAVDCFGGCFWTLGDTFGSGLTAGNWGMFNQNFTVNRAWISGPFSQWPGHL